MRSSCQYYLPLAAGFALGAQAASPLHTNAINITSFGSVKGRAALNSSVAARVPNWEQISFFGGIPYGADTSGANRWREPQPAAAWNGTLSTTDFGPICPFSADAGLGFTESEDCLSINIWTPATSADEKLPVAFWSYGDGTAPPQTTYDGAGMAAKGIVFVSYNFRNGPLGFFAEPDATESWGGETVANNATGNWGLLDQFHALKWVAENIQLFGGDPDHISVIGQSFGAAATYHLVNSPKMEEWGIVNAISESGLRSPSDPQVLQFECGYYNQTYAKTLASQVLTSLNVSTLAEARALSWETLVDATPNVNFKPVLDYFTIPSTYSESLRNGTQGSKVPFITGNNADEDGASPTLAANVSAYKAWLEEDYGSFASEFLALYPADNDTQAAESETTLIRDQFRVSSWQFMNDFANYSGGVNTYTYYWDYATPAQGSAGHASEVVYCLGNLWAQPGVNYTAEDWHIADVMSSYWANFIKTGDPNKGGSYRNGTLPATWEASSADSQTTFHVGQEYGALPVGGSAEKVALLEKFFAAQTPA